MLSACGGSGGGNSASAVPSIATTTSPSDAPSASTTAQAFPTATSLATSTPSSQASPAAISLATPLVLATITPTTTPSPTPTFAPFVSYSGHYSPNGNRVIRGPYGIQVAPRFAAIPGDGQSNGPLPIEFDYTIYDQLPNDLPNLGSGNKIVMLAKVTVTSPQTPKQNQSSVFTQVPQTFLNSQSPSGTGTTYGTAFYDSKYAKYSPTGWYFPNQQNSGLLQSASNTNEQVFSYNLEGTMVPGDVYYYGFYENAQVLSTPAPTGPPIFLDSKLRKN